MTAPEQVSQTCVRFSGRKSYNLATRPWKHYGSTHMIERVIVGPFHTNTYIVTIAKKQCIVIDPGADIEAIAKRLEVLNVAPRAILLTHGHLDHVSSAAEIVRRFTRDDFSPAVLMHPDDQYLLTAGENSPARDIFAPFGEEGAKAYERMVCDLAQVEPVLCDGFKVDETDLAVIHTPGHTPGSVCFYSEEREMLFSGDTLFFKAVGRTDFDRSDAKKLERSIQDILYELPPQTRLFPGHGPYSTIEREKANNRFTKDHQMV